MKSAWRRSVVWFALADVLLACSGATASTLYWTSYHFDTSDPQQMHGELFGLHRAATQDIAGTREELIHQLGYQPEYNALAASGGAVFALEFFSHAQHDYAFDGPANITPQAGADLIGAAIDSAGIYTYVASAATGVIQRGDFEYENKVDFIQTARTFLPTLVVALDEPHGRIYWAGAAAGGDLIIGRANLDGSGVEELPLAIYIDDYPVDLAVDSAAGKIYWTNSPQAAIQRANLDGTGVEDIVSGALVFSIALGVAQVPEPSGIGVASALLLMLCVCRGHKSPLRQSAVREWLGNAPLPEQRGI